MACCGAQLAAVQRGPCGGPLRAIPNPCSSRPACNRRTQRSLSVQPPLGREQKAAAAPLCQATGFSQPSSDQGSDAKLPNSREEAVQQAAAAISAQLNSTGGGGKGKGKGFSSTSCRKLAVDVPVVESGAAAMLQLAQDIVAALPNAQRQQFTIVACDDGAAAAGAAAAAAPVVSLQQCMAEGRDLDGCLLVAGPSSAQLDATMRLLAYWRGPAAVALNADWAAEQAPVEQVAFIKSFEAVYCFLPLMVKVLFIGQEGAVFKWCTGGSPGATPWRIFGKEGNRLAPIGRMQHRPSNADLESCFYNAYAANNPLNRGIKYLRGIGGDGKGGR